MDCLEVFIALRYNSDDVYIAESDLFVKINDMLLIQWEVDFHYARREANQAADWLAKWGAARDVDNVDWIELG
ncbi:hypothetical protein PIB30_073495, partial [Stylosanthes scabra]|nr:hypothetical protein [Stylosanthes scabra]